MRESEARQVIRDAGGSWDVFMDWMRGQTVSMYENGDTDFYECDVTRFVRYKCNPKNEPIVEFD